MVIYDLLLTTTHVVSMPLLVHVAQRRLLACIGAAAAVTVKAQLPAG